MIPETGGIESTLTKREENVRIGFDKDQKFGFKHVMCEIFIRNLWQ